MPGCPDCAETVDSEHNLIRESRHGAGRGHDSMTTADQIDALVAWHDPAARDALDAVRLRPFSTGYTAAVKLHRVWR